jgi:hypothetical protein
MACPLFVSVIRKYKEASATLREEELLSERSVVSTRSTIDDSTTVMSSLHSSPPPRAT